MEVLEYAISITEVMFNYLDLLWGFLKFPEFSGTFTTCVSKEEYYPPPILVHPSNTTATHKAILSSKMKRFRAKFIMLLCGCYVIY